MSEFEFLRHVTIGQYLPTGSIIHRLDPRAKILGFLALLAATMMVQGYTGALIVLALIILLTLLARIPLGFAFTSVRAALPFLVVFAVLQLIVPVVPQGMTCSDVARVGFVGISDCALYLVGLSTLRFVTLILLLGLLTYTTAVTEMAHGIEAGLRPLQAIGVPAHELSLVATIAIRFVPVLAEEIERLAKAQAARGADFGQGAGGIVTRVRRLLPLMVPLILLSLRRAEDLAQAMESRGYVGGKGRSHFVQLRARPSDWMAVGATVLIALVVMRGPWQGLDAAIWTRLWS